jgi:ATP-binding cassette subfamily B protein
MMFIRNFNFVAVAVVGGLQVASGAISLGDVQAFVVLAPFRSRFPGGVDGEPAVRRRRRSQISSLDAPRNRTGRAAVRERRGQVAFERPFSTSRPATDRGLSLVAEPGQTVAIVGPTGAGRPPWST